MTEKTMDINRETALSLWTKRYGKAVKVKDFSGREMNKGSYDDRNSKYGWNLDHILPKSRGGKDNESNLVCVNIQTNDEKADKYPVFNANGKTFEIIKVENHYEIHEKKSNEEKKEEIKEKGINFFDHTAAIKFLNECSEDGYYVDTIYIKIKNIKHKGLALFLKEIFTNYKINITVKKDGYDRSNLEIFAIINDVKNVKETNDILDCCVLINTYLDYYFKKHNYIESYVILLKEIWSDFPITLTHKECGDYHICGNENMLIINELVYDNSYANKEDLKNYNYSNDLYIYNYSYIKLRENLERIKE